MDSIKARNLAGMGGAFECLSALMEIGDVDLKERIGVEAVKIGVEKARECIVNSIELLDGRETILSDFYNPLHDLEYYNFDYAFVVCLYFGLYLFLALLYFLFWRGN
ncbi:protein kinase superfamily protein [Striga asiatica]|uniref:Protein kinase superfamily protein n=1 Tax=Striga asiatica TaxID=4170 RepID=A0A5A7QXF1_STRAF|nr:protein kinase superfamily protein [Striga asiatica]